MAIIVKHNYVSAIPDSGDTTIVQPSNWNDNHSLVGVGTMAEQNANSVAITGGTMAGVTITGYIPSTQKGVANGVATLDSGGQIPIAQIPPLGDLNYQGAWNATTNSPTLTSSVGTKGYYYVVSVAGTTSLNGITDWQIGDWAVFNGSVWQKIDNTDSVTSVNSKTGAVVLTYSDVGAFPATSTTGTGNVVLQTSPTISGATFDGASPYTSYTPTTAPTYLEGRVFYDSSAHTLNYYNDNSQMSVNIGQEQIVRVRNQTGSTITNGQVVYINGATGNTPTVALAIANAFTTADIVGVATTDIANNGFGYVTINGLVNNIDTSAFVDGNPVFVSATTPGAITATEPVAPNYSVQIGVILRANPSIGTLLVAPQQISCEVGHIVGTVLVSQGGTGQTSYTNGQLLIGNTTGNTLTKSTLTSGTGISVTNGAGSITITNSAPDQTVALTSGTGISVTGTYPNFTVTNTSPSSGGTVTSVTGTAPVVSSGGTTPAISMAKATGSVDGYLSATDWTTFNNKQPAGSYLTAVTADAPLSGSGTSGNHLVIATANTTTTGAISSTDWNTFNGKQAALVSGTNIKTVNGTSLLGSGDVPVGVLTVTGTSPVVSSGGANPAISMAAANSTTNGYLTSTDWTTFNSKQPAGTYVNSVSGTTGRITSSGGTTPAIDLASGIATPGTTGSSTLIPVITVDTYGRVTSITTASNPQGTVTSVTGTAPVVSSGGATPAISMAAATGSVNGYLTSTDWTTFNGKAPSVTYTSTYIPYGQGTTTPNLSSTFTFDGTTQTAPIQRASNGIVVNSKTVSASYSIASGDSAMSVGPVTVASGQTVTIASGSRWVVL